MEGVRVMEYQIGDFSRISSISIKALRYYHECGILSPTRIDDESGYRYYDESCLEKSKIITQLKDLDFSLKEIKEIVDNHIDDSELVDYMAKKAEEISRRIRKYEEVERRMREFIKLQEETRSVNEGNGVVIKDLPDVIIASIRFRGRYEETGKFFRKLFKSCGINVSGQPFSLYYDREYREEDADIEACVPVRREVNKEEVKSRILKGGKAITIVYRGPYRDIGQSYKAIIDYMNNNNIVSQIPSREIYIKGPGVILPGNPKKFITEIQMLL